MTRESSIFSKFDVGLSKRIYGILQIFETSIAVFVTWDANGCVASIKISKLVFPFKMFIISPFGRGLAIVASLPPSIANLDPYSVVVVVKMYELKLFLINLIISIDSLVPPIKNTFNFFIINH